MSRIDTHSNGKSKVFSRPEQNSQLLKLPQELQDHVVSDVQTGDLSSLSKACVDLRVTALPFLFQEIVLDSESPRTESLIRSLQRTLEKSAPLAGMIKTLHIKKARTSSDVLDRLIPYTYNLSTLCYDYFVDQSGGNRYDRIDAHRLSNQLSPVKDTLAHLKVTYEVEIPDEYFHERNIVGECSLKHLSALRTLEIPLYVLLGWDSKTAPRIMDMLPAGLFRLHFEEDA